MTERTSINILDFRHRNPIPNASRIGNLLMSGLIAGVDRGTQQLPEDLDQQLANLFSYVKDIVEAAGGTTKNIIKMNVWLKDHLDRQEVEFNAFAATFRRAPGHSPNLSHSSVDK